MADDPAQPPNDSVGHNALYLLVPLFAVTVVLYAARIYTRLGRKGKLTAADYAITIAMVCRPPSRKRYLRCFITRN